MLNKPKNKTYFDIRIQRSFYEIYEVENTLITFQINVDKEKQGMWVKSGDHRLLKSDYVGIMGTCKCI